MFSFGVCFDLIALALQLLSASQDNKGTRGHYVVFEQGTETCKN
jgi:hypothetical protein